MFDGHGDYIEEEKRRLLKKLCDTDINERGAIFWHEFLEKRVMSGAPSKKKKKKQ